MIYFITYILLSLAVPLFSFGKRISYHEVFFISLILTPIIGLIIALKAKNNILTHHYTTTTTCNSCNSEVSKDTEECPICGDEMNLSYNNETKLHLA